MDRIVIKLQLIDSNHYIQQINIYVWRMFIRVKHTNLTKHFKSFNLSKSF